MTRREEAAKMLYAWREAERTAEVFESLANNSPTSKATAETCRREANDLLKEILELMGVDTNV